MLKDKDQRMMFFSVLAIALITVFSLTALAEEDQRILEYGGFSYIIDESYFSYYDNSITITGCNMNTTHLIIPPALETDAGLLHVSGISNIREEWPVEMTSLELPSTVLHIEGNPWERCDQLKSIEVVAENPIFESVNGCLYNRKEKSLVCCPNGVDSITIKEGTLKIENMALGRRLNLKYVRIPKSLIIIDGVPVYDRPDYFMEEYNAQKDMIGSDRRIKRMFQILCVNNRPAKMYKAGGGNV